jgi:hypothetical protein
MMGWESCIQKSLSDELSGEVFSAGKDRQDRQAPRPGELSPKVLPVTHVASPGASKVQQGLQNAVRLGLGTLLMRTQSAHRLSGVSAQSTRRPAGGDSAFLARFERDRQDRLDLM